MPGRGVTTLGELMGKKGKELSSRELDFDDLPSLLGEGMPKLEFHPLGRVRLVQALRNRFGDGYRSVPGISELMRKFDQEAQTELKFHKLKQKLGGKHGSGR